MFFIEKSFELIKQFGILAFIIPNTWLTNLKFRKIRRFLIANNSILNISHYHKSVFNAVVDTEVVLFKKGILENNVVNVYRHLDANTIEVVRHNQNKWKKTDGETINIFSNEVVEKLIEKIKLGSFALSELCSVTTGMKPYQVGKGVPKQDKNDVQLRKFDSDERLDNSYKKLLRGRDINRYTTKWDGNRWIKYGDWLAEPRYSANFEADEKIVIRQTGDSLIATLDENQFVCMNNLHVILPKQNINLKYLLALINSRLLNYYFQYLNPEAGEALAEVKKENVEKLPIKLSHDLPPIITLVERSLSEKTKDVSKNISELENQINLLVYELYDLNEDEIKVIEDSLLSYN